MAGYIEKFGNFLALNIDGNRFLAYPTQGETWIITDADNGVGGGDTDPPGGGGGAFSLPFPLSAVSSEYGPRSGGTGSFHEGMDFGMGPAVRGANVFCIGDGTISQSGSNGGYGPYITVFHGSFAGNDWYSRYGHIDTYTRWSVGQTVSKGDLIGLEDDGGVSYGANLHLEIHQCPVGGGVVNNTANNGGYRTAINPRNFFNVYGDGGVLNP